MGDQPLLNEAEVDARIDLKKRSYGDIHQVIFRFKTCFIPVSTLEKKREIQIC